MDKPRPPDGSRPGPVHTIPAADLGLLVDNVGEYGIFLLDPSGRVASWNSGARNINGYEPSEIIECTSERSLDSSFRMYRRISCSA